MDERLRCRISSRAKGHFTQDSHRTVAAKVQGLMFIVSRTDPRTYTYLTHSIASEGVAVILDRRSGERRQTRQVTIPDRRDGERRQHDVTAGLRMYGWALVHRDRAPMQRLPSWRAA
jgi:hypothetical protein